MHVQSVQTLLQHPELSRPPPHPTLNPPPSTSADCLSCLLYARAVCSSPTQHPELSQSFFFFFFLSFFLSLCACADCLSPNHHAHRPPLPPQHPRLFHSRFFPFLHVQSVQVLSQPTPGCVVVVLFHFSVCACGLFKPYPNLPQHP